MQNQIKTALVHYRIVCKEIQSQKTDVNQALQDKDMFLLNELKRQVLDLSTKLEEAYHKLAELDDSFIDSEYSNYINDKRSSGVLLSKLEKEMSEIQHAPVSHDCRLNPTTLKLPKFELPKFDGKVFCWLSFKEIFESSVGKNPSLSNIEKMQYLKSALTDNAARLISGFAITNANYQEAWETLNARYDNKMELAYAQCEKIFNSESVKLNSAESIFELLDTCNEAARNLKTLGFEICKLSDVILVYCLKQKVDAHLAQQWELQNNGECPTYKMFIEFLERHARSIQNVKGHSKDNDKHSSTKTLAYSNIMQTPKPLCVLCKENHLLCNCDKFRSKTVEERVNVIIKHKCCFNCLRSNHMSTRCLFTSNCKICDRRHHTLLHKSKTQLTRSSDYQALPKSSQELESNSIHMSNSYEPNNIILPTALILVKNSKGEFDECRVLLDSGSQMSLITNDCCIKLGLSKQEVTSHAIIGINEKIVNNASTNVQITFKPYYSGILFYTNALVIDKLHLNVPNFNVSNLNFHPFNDVILADPEFNVARPIDIILGADLFFDLVEGEKIIRSGYPTAIKSKLGWILSGRVSSNNAISTKSANKVINCTSTVGLCNVTKRSCEVKSISVEGSNLTTERVSKTNCTENLNGNELRCSIVCLPFERMSNLDISRSQKYLHSLSGNMQTNSDYPEHNVDFMNNNIVEHHMKYDAPDSEMPKSLSSLHHDTAWVQSSSTGSRNLTTIPKPKSK